MSKVKKCFKWRSRPSSLGFVLSILALLLHYDTFSQHRNKNGTLVFNPFDFQIVKNYIRLNDTIQSQGTGCHPSIFVDPAFKVKFEFISNCQDYEAIHFIDLKDSNIDYYLNYQTAKPQSQSNEYITIVTSRRGEVTNKKAIQHFLSLIDQIKIVLLEPQHFNFLFHYLSRRKETFVLDSRSFVLGIVDHQIKTIEVSPSPDELSSHFIPYKVEQKLSKRHTLTKWYYLLPEEKNVSDDFFFKHYSDLLLEAQNNGAGEFAN